jgi:hypothetical protein
MHALLTPRGVLTFDPDKFGKAKFRQSEAIGEFLIFEILDLASKYVIEGPWAYFLFSKIIYMLSLDHEVS